MKFLDSNYLEISQARAFLDNTYPAPLGKVGYISFTYADSRCLPNLWTGHPTRKHDHKSHPLDKFSSDITADVSINVSSSVFKT